MAIINEKDLSEALKNDKDTIEIEGDLADKVIRIKATGSVAWAIAIGSIAVGLAAIFRYSWNWWCSYSCNCSY